jgi:SAM-dependent methyltransferase
MHAIDAVSRRAEFCAWFKSPLGRALQAAESQQLRAILPQLYGTVALQLGRVGEFDLMDACVAPTRILLDKTAGSERCQVCAQVEELPLDSKSVDVVILPHTLDFSDDPHQVLREAARVLRPEGHVVVLGFNPLSLWGVRRLFTRRPRTAPWNGNFYRLARIKDWVKLLDFEFTRGQMLFYRPPFARESFMDRLFFLDRMGDRWWPMMAAVYVVVAKKRVHGVTPLPVAWKTRRLRGSVSAEPAARILVRRAHLRRVK